MYIRKKYIEARNIKPKFWDWSDSRLDRAFALYAIHPRSFSCTSYDPSP